jgi:L-ascorbate metabolism protein UlaG (beta-lactamase superfamily)
MRTIAVGTLAFILSSVALAETSIKWFGHSAFQITTPQKRVILIDPWITNPANKTGAEDLASLNKADLILISHGHGDHIGDAAEIAAKTKAGLVATYDLKNALVEGGLYPKEYAGSATGHFGGEIELLQGDLRITFIPAVHGSTIWGTDKSAYPDKIMPGGTAGGFLLSIKQGPTIYFTGDTDLFSDMALVSLAKPVDVMISCIGGGYTMGPLRAAHAVRLVKPRKYVIPMHTEAPENVQDFLKALKKIGEKGVMARVPKLDPGGTLEL